MTFNSCFTLEFHLSECYVISPFGLKTICPKYCHYYVLDGGLFVCRLQCGLVVEFVLPSDDGLLACCLQCGLVVEFVLLSYDGLLACCL